MTIKATRKLTNFNFDVAGAHIALVGPSVGGAANGHTTLLTKSTKDITTKEVEKATEVNVTMNIVDFLTTFFDLWYDDAIVLAKIMGLDTEPEVDTEEYHNWYEDWINERVEAVTIMKSLVVDKELDEIKKSVAELSSKDYLAVLSTQVMFEKNFESVKADIKKSSTQKEEGVTAPENLIKGVISPSVDNKKEEDTMSEFISKAAHQTAIEKAVKEAVAEKDVLLTKALEQVKELETEKVEALSKARKDAIDSVEKDAGEAEQLFKSLSEVSDEVFEVVLKALKKEKEKVEQSDLLKEVGSQGREVTPEKPDGVNKTADLLKAQFQEKGAK